MEDQVGIQEYAQRGKGFSAALKKLYSDCQVIRFSIVLSKVIGDENLIKVNLDSFKTNGFINYYETQYFRTRAHLVGKQLLLSQWQRAIDLILEEFQSQQKFNQMETELRSFMKKDATDLVGALNTIPFSMRLTYIRAYQSFIWNTAVSKRIAAFGMKPILGDLVNALGIDDDSCDLGLQSFEKIDNYSSNSSNKNDCVQCKFIFIDKNNIHNYTIDDVVLPLPGYDITYPINEVAEWYRNLLLVDELTEMDFKREAKKYSLKTTYRRLISKPSDLSWKFVPSNSSSQRHFPIVLNQVGKTELFNAVVEDSGKPNTESSEEEMKLSQVDTSAISQPKKQNSSTFKSVLLASAATGKRKPILSPPAGFEMKYEDDTKPMSYEEKIQLSVGIQLLPSDKLARVVHIFRSLEQVDGPIPEEVVVDLDKLKLSTLRVLQLFMASDPTTKFCKTYEARQLNKGKNKRELADTLREVPKADSRNKVCSIVTKQVADVGIGIASNAAMLSNSKADGNFDLVVEFNILPSSYVTMAVREIMKMDVSAVFGGGTEINSNEEIPQRNHQRRVSSLNKSLVKSRRPVSHHRNLGKND
ncbi:uncharacterized protein LOC116931670 isoform X2 [Daphnia magna]|uniref:uncharacterized protein LOC116931670 isoform X2 n=1 Tax=Daphnia magna TaxID=35525 RepID=UPI001E1BC59F|nr:uncharacterized protein LOC116931670 isoform X2 [Daphnia magna]